MDWTGGLSGSGITSYPKFCACGYRMEWDGVGLMIEGERKAVCLHTWSVAAERVAKMVD